MTVTKRLPTLTEERVYTDQLIEASIGADHYGAANRQYEKITDLPAPGSARTVRGHVHDGNGDGRGIFRVVNGGFYCWDESGPPITRTTSSTAGESVATSMASIYPNDGTDYQMGVAYVSPGLAAIKVEYLAKHGDAGRTVSVLVKNITDNQSSTWQTITTSATWYTSSAITVSSPGDGKVKRITLDIRVKVDASSDTVTVGGAFPFEHTDQA